MPGKITSRDPATWQELETIVQEILTEAGFEAKNQVSIKLTRGSVNVDVLAEERIDGILFRTIFECKNWKTNIPQEVVHAFRTVMLEVGAHRGYIVSKVGFQSGAKEAAESTNIDLVTFDEFQNLFFEKWIAARRWSIEHEIGSINTYYEPFGIPGITKVDNETHGHEYVAAWKRHMFVGCLLPLFSPYTHMVSNLSPKELPIDTTKLENQGIYVPSDLAAQTHYREYFDLLTKYGRIGLAELRSLNPITRNRDPSKIERDD